MLSGAEAASGFHSLARLSTTPTGCGNLTHLIISIVDRIKSRFNTRHPPYVEIKSAIVISWIIVRRSLKTLSYPPRFGSGVEDRFTTTGNHDSLFLQRGSE